MKRFVGILLALMMLVSFCACGASETTSKKEDQVTETQVEIKKPEEKKDAPQGTDAAEGADAGKETETGKGTETGAEDPAAAQSAAAYTIADEVIVDDENCAFIIKKAEDDPIWGFTLKAYCENKTSDKTLMFSIDGVSVNGYMADPFWAEILEPGKKSNDDITFSTSDFEKIGIAAADEIIFSLRVYDSDDWSADDLVNDVFTIYPTGLSADAVVYPERRTTAAEQVLFDNDEYSFIILDQEDDSFWGYTLDCFIENKTDKTLVFSWNNVCVNGYMIDPYWATEITPGMKAYSGVSFSSSDFEEVGITAADEIIFTFRIYETDNWFADDLLNDVYTIYPTGLNPEAVVYPERRTTASEQVVIDNDQICFIVLDQKEDSIWGYTVDCYIENRTDALLTFSWDNVSVNGYMIDPYWATDVAPGMRKYCSVHFSSYEFEDNDITEVEEIGFSLRVYDYDDWSVDESYNETLVFKKQ